MIFHTFKSNFKMRPTTYSILNRLHQSHFKMRPTTWLLFTGNQEQVRKATKGLGDALSLHTSHIKKSMHLKQIHGPQQQGHAPWQCMGNTINTEPSYGNTINTEPSHDDTSNTEPSYGKDPPCNSFFLIN